MTILLAILTCPRFLDRRNAIRDTWLKSLNDLKVVGEFFNVDVRFFSGRLPCLADDYLGDIVHLDCPDSYEELPLKTYALAKYAQNHNYDYLLKCDDDSYLVPIPDVMDELFVRDHCVGHLRIKPTINDGIDYSHGGCYTLPRRGIAAVVEHPELFTKGIEDGAVGRAMQAAGVPLKHEARIFHNSRQLFAWGSPNGVIAAHQVKPDLMYQLHETYRLSILAYLNDAIERDREERTLSKAAYMRRNRSATTRA